MLANYRPSEEPIRKEGATIRYLWHEYQLNSKIGRGSAADYSDNWTVDTEGGIGSFLLVIGMDWVLPALIAYFDGGWSSVAYLVVVALLDSELHSLYRRVVDDLVPRERITASW